MCDLFFMRQRTHRTTISVELDALEHAQRVLGTRGYVDTINGALREVARQDALRRAAALIRSGGPDIVAPEDLNELRKPRGA